MDTLSIIFTTMGFILTAQLSAAMNYNCTGSYCGECTIKGPKCAWCRDLNFTSESRCGTMEDLIGAGCAENQIVIRKKSRVRILQADPLEDGGQGKESVQLTPQHVKVYLVPNEADYNNFTIYYKVAKNFPLDLYFLNDPSFTMRNLRTSLQAVAGDISREINKTTTDYRFGLGTSMDKVALPFTRTSPEQRVDPCLGSGFDCDPPHSYINRYKLSANVPGFIAAVNAVNLTANLDKPEGLLDGLMQAMVCGDRIGWRTKARRMLVYASDINYHMAGDARIAGILPPNDAKCHLDGKGMYTMAELQDYPSISQVKQVATENNINIIFTIGGTSGNAVENEQIKRIYYDELAKILPGSAATVLTASADNIVSIVSENYRRLRERVVLEVKDLNSEDIERVMFFTACYGDIINFKSSCTGLTTDQQVEFRVVIQTDLLICPTDRNLTFSIVPQGLEDRVRVDVEWDCDCECEKGEQVNVSSEYCNGNGDLKCGICDCYTGWTGEFCDCDERFPIDDVCNNGTGLCSGVGECVCGKCVCENKFLSGRFCECDETKCDIPSGSQERCGGPGQGYCDCNVCKCAENFNGNACQCTDDKCKNSNGTICSDNGICDCDQCKCNDGYNGRFCERCTLANCTENPCVTQRDCVLCTAYGEGSLSTIQCDENCKHVEVVAGLDAADKFCRILTSDGCFVEFTYELTNGTLQYVRVRSTKVGCSTPASLQTIGLGIAGAILGIGILLLIIWKLLTMLYDSVEFSKFEVEINNPAWERQENPIYKDCVTTVQNPVHDMNAGGVEKPMID